MNESPLFQFGYGLSYTTFTIGNAQLNTTSMKDGESVDLTIPVSNTGKRNGTEVLQVYVRKVDDVDGPTKTLRGFQKVNIAAGKTSNATISLPYNAFEFFDTLSGSMKVTSGGYEIWYGNSSATKDLKMIKVMIK